MATAAICLKFTSLTKNKSKCYLEIVPQVTNVQNIDKIKWKDNIDSIEYLVPVTYKIILKKLNTVRDNDAVRMYHSCVDLVPSLSLSQQDLAYRDISQTISDHLIYRSLNEINACVSLSGPIALNVINENTNTLQNVETAFENKHVKRNTGTCISESLVENFKEQSKFQIELNNKNSVATFTDVPQQSSCETKTLTIAPVCKIDTFEAVEDKYIVQEIESPLSKSIVRYKPVRSCSQKRCFNEDQFIYHPRWNISFDCDISPNSFLNLNARVSYFKSVMEKEVLPLKIILQDLITKCNTFGLLRNSDCNNKCINEKFTFENKKYCNRVVYSIIFDE